MLTGSQHVGWIYECTVQAFAVLRKTCKRPVVLTTFSVANTEKLWIKTNPRYLPFPMGLGNKIQIITGFGIPIDVTGHSLSLGLILKTNYELPTNISMFTEMEGILHKSTPPSRWLLYKTFEAAFSRLSVGGRSCLLRSICEAAYMTFDHYSNGIMGEILHLLLVPSASIENDVGDQDYTTAEMNGKTAGDKCEELYPQCSTNLLDTISLIQNEVERLIL